jgi:hypothetical protein
MDDTAGAPLVQPATQPALTSQSRRIVADGLVTS